MKISLSDLKKALQWIDANTNESHVKLELFGPALILTCKDKYEQQIDIKLFEDSMMLPKIRKETVLK
jgi:hypothetical protein